MVVAITGDITGEVRIALGMGASQSCWFCSGGGVDVVSVVGDVGCSLS